MHENCDPMVKFVENLIKMSFIRYVICSMVKLYCLRMGGHFIMMMTMLWLIDYFVYVVIRLIGLLMVVTHVRSNDLSV